MPTRVLLSALAIVAVSFFIGVGFGVVVGLPVLAGACAGLLVRKRLAIALGAALPCLGWFAFSLYVLSEPEGFMAVGVIWVVAVFAATIGGLSAAMVRAILKPKVDSSSAGGGAV